MAKYCVFCGSELPDVAQFCPICGKRQPAIQTETEKETKPLKIKKESFEEDEDSAELDLLSQFGFVSPQKKTPPFTPTTIKQEPVKAKEPVKTETPVRTESHKTEEKSKSQIVNQTKKPETHTVELKDEKSKSSEKEIIPEVEIKEEPKVQPVIKNEPSNQQAQQKVTRAARRQSVRQERAAVSNPVPNSTSKSKPNPEPVTNPAPVPNPTPAAVPFQPTEKIEPTNAMPTTNSSEAKYELPDDFDKDVESEFNADNLFEQTPPEEEEAMRRAQEEEKDKEAEAIAAKRKDSEFKKKEKKILDDDEEESFNTTLKESSNATHMLEQETLYADEVQANIDRKKAVVDDDDDTSQRPERRRRVEGRKNMDKADKRKRRRSVRDSDINKKIYNIEQDMSQVDPDEEEYDGYYENVLPLDAGQVQKFKLDPKYILIALGLLALIGGAVFIIVKMLGF